MPRICEVCGRLEEVENDDYPYDILDVCTDCSDHLIFPATTKSES